MAAARGLVHASSGDAMHAWPVPMVADSCLSRDDDDDEILPADLLRAYLGPTDYPHLYTDLAHEPPRAATRAVDDPHCPTGPSPPGSTLPPSLDTF
jgi:hypothetical protein